MLGRLRRRRVLLAALAAGLAALPALFAGVTAAPAGSDNLLPPEPSLEPLPPDAATIQAALILAQEAEIADLVPEAYRTQVVLAANRHGVDPRLVASIITVETQWRTNVVGIYGEKGLMQILPSTGQYLASEAGLSEYDLADPVTSIELGTLYIASLLGEYGTQEKALAAYNGGPAAVERAENHPYVRKVMEVYSSLTVTSARPAPLAA